LNKSSGDPFHNARSGLCFPSYEKIAERAGCARSTVAEAIKSLEDAGILSWVNRIKRVWERVPGLPGIGATQTRVVRTSNAYVFNEVSSKSEKPTGTPNQGFPFLKRRAADGPQGASAGKKQVLRHTEPGTALTRGLWRIHLP
jgi:hypothetical protein